MRGLVLFSAAAFGLTAALLFGGATRAGYLSTGVAQLACLPALGLSARTLLKGGVWREMRAPLLIATGGVLLPAAQLIPMPPTLWSALPGRTEFADLYGVAGLALPWAPVSLDPYATLRSAVALIPGLAIFLAVAQLEARFRRRLVLLLAALAALHATLGLVQLTAGEGALRPYTITNDTEAVGLFANRNHLVALLTAALPLFGAWAAFAGKDAGSGRARRWLLCGTLCAPVAVVLLLSGSRAGLLLAIPAAVASAALAAYGVRRHEPAFAMALAAGTVGLALLALTQVLAPGLVSGLTGGLDPVRSEFVAITGQAARRFAPLGSGFGTFVPVYQVFEQPERLRPAFANHAHNDWLELWLEGGLPMLLLLAAFLAWLTRTCLHLRRTEGRSRDYLRRQAIPAAGGCVILLLLAHSLAEYPLRTPALMALFGFACALLVRAPEASRTRELAR